MKKAYFFPFVSIFFWSTVSVISKLLLNSYNNFQVLWISSFLAAASMFLINLIKGNLKLFKVYKLKDYAIMVLIGLPGTLLYYVFYYAGTDAFPETSQAFILNYMWPIMSVVFACIILKEKMTFVKAIAIGISFVGIIIVMGENLLNINFTALFGAACCILGAVSYGVFTALNRKFSYHKSFSLMLSYIATFLITTVVNAVTHGLFLPRGIEVIGFAWNGVLTMALANVFWVTALSSGETAKISNLAYITPFASLIWASLILHEPLRWNFIVGLIVIVCGILLQFYMTKDPRKEETKE